MGPYYSELGISSGDVGGAIAEGILEDIRVNGLGLRGFPAVHVARDPSGDFNITLRFNSSDAHFTVSAPEALSAVKKMKARAGHDDAIFRRIQDAAVVLEANR